MTEDMPITFMRYFYLGANLRWLMSTTKWPTHPLYDKMTKIYEETVLKTRGSSGIHVADFVPFGGEDSHGPQYDEVKEVKLSTTVYESLHVLISSQSPGPSFASLFAASPPHLPVLNNRVNHIRCVKRGNMTFATHKAGPRNLYVLFNDPLEPAELPFPRAGRITDMFLHGRLEHGKQVVEPFVLIDEYEPLCASDAEHDPYRRFTDIETRAFYNHFKPDCCLVRLQDVQCHFASLVSGMPEIEKECIVVRSLNWVRFHLFKICNLLTLHRTGLMSFLLNLERTRIHRYVTLVDEHQVQTGVAFDTAKIGGYRAERRSPHDTRKAGRSPRCEKVSVEE